MSEVDEVNTSIPYLTSVKTDVGLMVVTIVGSPLRSLLAEQMRADADFLRGTEEGYTQRDQAVRLEDVKRELGD